MRIVIVLNERIPARFYGGIERVIWSLGKELVRRGHKVSYLVREGSSCPFAEIIPIDSKREILDQIPKDADIVHFNVEPSGLDRMDKAYIVTMHGNTNERHPLSQNTVFISRNHAARYGSNCFVYNGLDWSEYKTPDFSVKRDSFHFLGNAAWRVKNVKAAIQLMTSIPNARLNVLGGSRFNVNMGIRFTFSAKVRFYGMVGGDQKDSLLNSSKGLIFPVRWHEPFGLALIESLYFGCPVFGTPYGSLPEIISSEYGFLSNKKEILKEAIENVSVFSNKACHEYSRDQFNSGIMAQAYLDKYQQILDGEQLNPTCPRLIEVQTEKFLPWYD